MRIIKELIRLKDAGLSNRKIADSCSISASTVSEVLNRAKEIDLIWTKAQTLDEEELEQALFSERQQVKGPKKRTRCRIPLP